MRVHITSKGTGETTDIVDRDTGARLDCISEIHFAPIRAREYVRCTFVTRATIDVDAEVYEPLAECKRLQAEVDRLTEEVNEMKQERAIYTREAYDRKCAAVERDL